MSPVAEDIHAMRNDVDDLLLAVYGRPGTADQGLTGEVHQVREKLDTILLGIAGGTATTVITILITHFLG